MINKNLENLLMSAFLHAIAVLVAVALSLAAPMPNEIAPNRIKILHIDLKNVKITGLETALKNINDADAAKKQTEAKNPTVADTAKPEEPVMQTIRVNRETARLDRTMTVSVIDAFRIAMTRCWQIDQTRPDLRDIRAVAHLKLFPNGKVHSYWFEQAARADTDFAFAYVLETIKSAIDACQPFAMLPRAEYEEWKSVQLTFFPTAKIVE
ncbi:MAG: hypothetical protein LBQ49_02270 [Rickettsiales bacterium]|jgi:hypothetical protein|nr:hypothetical protein [Rickettsiales bacterium]